MWITAEGARGDDGAADERRGASGYRAKNTRCGAAPADWSRSVPNGRSECKHFSNAASVSLQEEFRLFIYPRNHFPDDSSSSVALLN